MTHRFTVVAASLLLPSVAVGAELSAGVVMQSSTTCFERRQFDPYGSARGSYLGTCDPAAGGNGTLTFLGGGALVGLALEPRLALVAGALLSRKGFHYYFFRGAYDLRLRFVELPIQLRFVPWPKARATPYLSGGVFAGCRLANANTDIVIHTWDGEELAAYERRTNWARIELGVTGGVGVRTRIGRVELFAQVDVGRGLTDLYRAANLSDKSHLVRVSLGGMVGTKKAKMEDAGGMR